MALLLAMFQKMRLVREKNQATLDLTKFSSKYDRVSKNIERVQKMYESRIAKLDSQATRMKNSASIFFRNSSGLGVSAAANNMNYASFNGMTSYVMNCMASAFASGQLQGFDENGKPVQGAKYNDGNDATEKFKYLLSKYQIGGLQALGYKIENGKPVENAEKNGYEPDENVTKADIAAFQYALNAAHMQEGMAQNQLSTMMTGYDNQVSIWLEAQKEQLEAEQDAALEPLKYQETMWELEKNLAEQRLKRIESELQSYDQLCDKEAQNSAPKFGV